MRLIRDGEKRGKGVWRWGEREIYIYLSLHCHHQNGQRGEPLPECRGVVKYRPGQAETAVRDGENFGH